MAPQYKLVYFNFTSLGEPIRYIFSYGKIPFEDYRIQFAQYDKFKADTPYGKLPYLEVDGKVLTQSTAICRYLAKKIDLAGKTDWEAALVDAAVDNMVDLRMKYSAYFQEQSESRKEKMMDDIKKIHNDFYLSRFEKLVKENGGYFVNGQLTWADMFFACTAETLETFVQGPVVDAYPNLRALQRKVEKLPGIKEYRVIRPEVEF